ncbi:MFS transporter [Nonomuraea candida]|uniref:MFS transporter n=1 Tax=Nonomuraea candida TaxID=359159 RepID=UPI0006949CF6|nr:MFS transporter [Nonomuraea candida]
MSITRSAPRTLVAGPAAPPAGAVPLLAATALVVLAQLYVSIPLHQPVAADLGPAGATAALAAGYSFAYALGFLIYGPLSDHYGRRRILVYGLLILTIATFAVSLAPSTGALAVLRAVQGLAAATFAPTALAYLGEALPPGRRAAAIGALSVAFLTAGILGQLAATATAAVAGWRGTFSLSGLLLAALTAASFAVIREPAADRPRLPLPARYAGLVRFALRPRSLLLALGHLVVLGGFVGMYSLLGPHLALAGLTSADIMLVRAAALPAMLCSLLAGPLAVRLGPRRTALTGFVLASAGLAAESMLGGSLPGLVAASVVFVAGVAVLVPTMIALWGEAAQPARGVGMAVNGFVLFLGAGLGSYVTELPGGFGGALGIVSALYLAAGLAVHASRASGLRR